MDKFQTRVQQGKGLSFTRTEATCSPRNSFELRKNEFYPLHWQHPPCRSSAITTGAYCRHFGLWISSATFPKFNQMREQVSRSQPFWRTCFFLRRKKHCNVNVFWSTVAATSDVYNAPFVRPSKENCLLIKLPVGTVGISIDRSDKKSDLLRQRRAPSLVSFNDLFICFHSRWSPPKLWGRLSRRTTFTLFLNSSLQIYGAFYF